VSASLLLHLLFVSPLSFFLGNKKAEKKAQFYPNPIEFPPFKLSSIFFHQFLPAQKGAKIGKME